ncbi:MAG: thioesterase [Alphaproteobacteria bacterium]|nr:thioesterase [Alphaproteobacteria bacterium]
MNAFEVYRGSVNTWECDQMGHMNVQHYLSRLSHAWAHLRAAIGLDAPYLRDARKSLVAVRDVIQYKAELHAGEPVHMTAEVAEIGDRTVRYLCELKRSGDEAVSARFDTVGLFFNLESRKAATLPADIRAKALARKTRRADIGPLPAPNPLLASVADDRLVETYRGAVNTWECDYLGHMNIQYYTSRFSDAAGHAFHAFGLDRDRHYGTAAVQYDVHYLKELRAGDMIHVRTGLVGLGNKSINFIHRLYNSLTGEVCCSIEIFAVVFDLQKRKAVPIPDAVRRAAEPSLLR